MILRRDPPQGASCRAKSDPLFSEKTAPMPLHLQESTVAAHGRLPIPRCGIVESTDGRAKGQPGGGMGG